LAPFKAITVTSVLRANLKLTHFWTSNPDKPSTIDLQAPGQFLTFGQKRAPDNQSNPKALNSTDKAKATGVTGHLETTFKKSSGLETRVAYRRLRRFVQYTWLALITSPPNQLAET